jgi:DUF2934 family protein
MPRTTKQPTTSDAVTRKRTATKRSTSTRGATTEVADTGASASAGDIAQRAYELYCARGCAPGRELEDWLRAEQELSV